jgi:hypothetical protein
MCGENAIDNGIAASYGKEAFERLVFWVNDIKAASQGWLGMGAGSLGYLVSDIGDPS